MTDPLSILVIEDNPADHLLLERTLRDAQLSAECVRIDSNRALDAALERRWDLVLADYNVPGMQFRESLRSIQARAPGLPVILVSESIGEEEAVDLIHLGLADFVLKDHIARLPHIVGRALDGVGERTARRSAEASLHSREAQALEDHRMARLAALNLLEDARDERRRAEEARDALRASEEKYRLLAENAADWIFSMNAEGRFQYVSPACEAITGHPPEAFLRDHQLMTSIVHPEDRPAYVAHIDALATAAEAEREFRVLHTDGSLRWVAHRCRPVTDDAGRFAGRLGSNRDVTARRLADERLRVREASYRSMFAANPSPMWVFDAETLRFLDVNDAAVNVYGYSREEFLAMTIRDIRPPEDLPRLDAVAGQADHHGRNAGVWRHLRRNGAEMRVEVIAHGIDFNGRRATVVLANDVTQRLQTEEQLRKLSMAVEQSPACIVITDTHGRIEYVNETFVQVTGYSRDEAAGRNPSLLQAGDTPASVYASLWTSLAEGRTWKGEFRNRRKDGSTYIAFGVVSPIRQANGQTTHYLAIEEDITERKRAALELDAHRHHLEALVASRTEEANEARLRADAANEAKSAFLANMSHEIRTPMNAIIGLTHLLQQSSLVEAQRERLHKIDGAALHLLSIINDILDLSKIEAGKMQLDEIDFDLPEILAHVHALIAQPAADKGIEVRVDCAGVPVWLHGDPTRLRQGLLNFASNAVKFTERGSVTLRATLQQDSGDELLVRFEAIDTGIGIPRDKLSGLFQPFQQADASTTRKYGGTGLGLTITRRLAAMMGGDAGATSSPGEGSTFWFTARIHRARGPRPLPASAKALRPDTAASNGDARILVVEDNEINLEVAVEILRAGGYRTEVAENGRIAVDKVRDETYDLILMDMQMPELDGLEATRLIRTMPDRSHVPILAMTANAFEEDRQACLAAGMNDFISKPIDPEGLYAVLARWLRRPA